MTDKLPPHLLALFAPRPALRYIIPGDHSQEERHTSHIDGVSSFLEELRTYNDNYEPTESWLQKRDRLKLEKKEAAQHNITVAVEAYKPSEDPQIRGDALKTLFVARLSFDTKQEDLEKEFGRYGPIERMRIVYNTQAAEDAPKKKKCRGYAFIVYERERDMKAAYKEADNLMIKGRRVLVDVERGRTVTGWRPRRFGGGLGGRGYTKAATMRPSAFGGAFAPNAPGGFRGGGGFRGNSFPRGGGFRGGPRGGFGDRGGFGGDRGGFGGDRGGYGGGRGGIGYQPNGFAAPDGAPAGPRGRGGYGGGGGFGGGGGRSSYGGGYDGGRSHDDRGASGSNMEPVRQRDRGDYRDRERGGDRGSDRGGGGYDDRERYSRKREYDGDGYDSRNKRRY